ncbi:phage tail length tape measure family protein [Sinorhizobium alkalisoli]|uniref:phage tail length tape measure family protein n=1 Tax=Sinorhizobium alkalisoli TaxID=1752398 RepID=UPI0012A874F9|nr:phage tail length tape measure family protein [Sinorhizobium alkalisoli]QFI65795.1 putative tail component of prophage [Sinorhizobium alkalisoli]
MDVAQLGIEVTSKGAPKATADLQKLTNAAKMADSASDGLSASTKNAGAAASAAAGGFKQAASATKAYAAAANSNVKRMGGSMSGLAAQFQDIGVTAAMGMNPMLIALQQGTQIAGQMEMAMQGGAKASSVFSAAFASLLSPVTLVSIALTAAAAAGLQLVDWAGLAASALTGLADVLQTIAPYAVGAAAALALLYAPAIIGGIISVIALLARLSVAAVSAGAAMLAANPAGALVLGITAAVAAANIFRDELAQIFGRDIVADAKNGVNFIIGAFVGGFNAIKATWSALPGAIGDFVYATANAVVAGTELMVNMVVAKIDELIAKLNASMKSLPFGLGDSISIPTIGKFDFGRVENPYKGQAAAVATEASAAMSSAMSTDYVGGFGEAISRGASAASAKLKELAKDLTTVDDKSKKKKGGAGGKTEAEKYSDIVDGANRRIASLKAEQAALGMTEQAALALKYETELLNQAQQKGINLTASQKAELAGLAQQMASTEIATRNTKEAMDFAKDATKGFLSDLRSGLANGEGFWKSFGKAALNVLDKIIGKIEDQLVEALFSVGSASTGTGGGGFLGAIFGGIGKLFGFASGGYTGGKAASSVAGVVHGGEYVFSKRATDRIGVGNLESMHRAAKGYASGGYVAPAPANQNGSRSATAVMVDVRTYVDEDGNWQSEVERISQKEVRKATPGIVNASKQQSVPAMAEYQSNKANADWRS